MKSYFILGVTRLHGRRCVPDDKFIIRNRRSEEIELCLQSVEQSKKEKEVPGAVAA